MPARRPSPEEQREIALKTLKRLELVLYNRQTKVPRGGKDWDGLHEDLFLIRRVAFLLGDEEVAP